MFRLHTCVVLMTGSAVLGCSGQQVQPATPANTSLVTASSGQPTPLVAPSSDATAPRPIVAATTPEPPKPTRPEALVLVPARIRNSYPSTSPKGISTAERLGKGWNVSLAVAPSKDASRGEWAGYCWEIAPVDGTQHDSVSIELPEVRSEAEVEVKLEMLNSQVQESNMQYLKQGTIDIGLSVFPKVRPEIGRVCIMLLGRSIDKGPKKAEFVLSQVVLK